LEDELIVQQNEYERRRPEENIRRWFDTYSKMYEQLSETSSPIEAFSKLIIIKNEIELQLEQAKNALESFSKQLKAILIDENLLEHGSELEQLHHNISLSCLLTFTSSTFGNFMHGGTNMDKSKKEMKRIKKDFPDSINSIKPLQEIVREYVNKTKQKNKRGIISKIPKAFERRFLADKLYYQKIALDILIQRLFLYDFPSEIPKLTTLQQDRLDKFLAESQKKRNATSPELYRDIYLLIKRLKKSTDEPHLFNSEGKLVYSVVAGIALDDHEDNPFQDFAKKWKKTKKNPNGFSKTWLEKKIKEIYERVISL